MEKVPAAEQTTSPVGPEQIVRRVLQLVDTGGKIQSAGSTSGVQKEQGVRLVKLPVIFCEKRVHRLIHGVRRLHPSRTNFHGGDGSKNQ